MDSTKYKKIAKLLISDISNGKYEPLGSFPSDRYLMKKFNVSRQTIRLAIRELEDDGLLYRRQGKGTFLSKKASKLNRGIGVIVSGGRYSEIFSVICSEISELVGRAKFQILVGDVSYKNPGLCARRTLEMARKLVASKVCGVIYQPVQFLGNSTQVNQEVVSMLRDAGIPVVLIDCDIVFSPDRSEYDVVSINNFDAGRRIADHLLRAGAKDIRFFCEPCCAASVKCRMYGVGSMLGKYDGSLLVEINSSSVKEVGRYLKDNPQVDAIVCQNDIAAVNLIATLKRLGYSIPDDIMVAGFDDVAYAKIQRPSLTSIRQPCKDIAMTAYNRLMERMSNKTMTPTVFELSAPLIVRESTVRA